MKFLDPCGTPHGDDPQFRELWEQPQVFAFAYWPVQQIIDQATAEIAEWFSSGRLAIRPPWKPDWTSPIAPTFLAHDFWVPAAMTWRNGQKVVEPMCVAGMGDGNYGEIFVSVRNPARVPGLIRWETGNARLMQAGRHDWADRWHLMTPDPGHRGTQRRRSARP